MNKGCFKCHEPERETVFELDETSRDKAQTLMKSPDFQKVVTSPDSKFQICAPDFQKVVSGKPDFSEQGVSEKPPLSNDDLYSLRPMKVATPIRVGTAGARTPPSGTAGARTPPSGGAAVRNYSAELPNGAFDGHPDATQYDLSPVGMSQLEIDRFLKVPGDNIPEDAAARDARWKQEELMRTKLLSESQPQEQNSLPLDQACVEEAKVGTDNAALSSVQASSEHSDVDISGSSDPVVKEREARKLKLKAEVAALREQVMRAKAARVGRGVSLEKEFSVAGSTAASTVDSTEDVDGQPMEVAPQGPDLWGSRRRIPNNEEQPQYPDLQRNPQHCLSGGTDRLCFPARQCA